MIYGILTFTAFLQGSLFSIPFIIPIILLYFIFSKKESAFFAAAVFGILIDILLLNPLGATSIFLIIFLFISTMYTRIFEAENFYFAAVFTLIGSGVYSYIFYPSDFVLKAIVCLAIVVFVYLVMRAARRAPSVKIV